MDKILSLIKGEVCMGTYVLVELELRRLVKEKLISTNKPSTSISNLTCSDCCKPECRYRDVDSLVIRAFVECTECIEKKSRVKKSKAKATITKQRKVECTECIEKKPSKNIHKNLAHEIWSASQLLPNEGIEDGVKRIEEILEANCNIKKQDGDWVDASEILPKHGQIVDIYRTYQNMVSKDSKYYLKPKIVNNLTAELEYEDYKSYICLHNNAPGAGRTFGPPPFYIYENGDFSHWRLVTKPEGE